MQRNEALQETQAELLERAQRLYEQFGKPLEAEHLGQFVAIAPDGRTLVGESAGKVGREAKDAFGAGNFVFRLGSRVVGKWR
jgi:hypothetical protein